MPEVFPPDGLFLKKMRVGELDRELQENVLAVANELGYESAVRTTSNLAFLWELYNSERVKQKRSRTKLKKAENLILKLASLDYGRVREEARREERKAGEKRPFSAVVPPLRAVTGISERLRKIFESIGLSDEKVMEKAVESLGEKEIEERAELALSSRLGEKTVKALFSSSPKLILEQDFWFRIETIEQKKEMLDWESKRKTLPPELDYRSSPAALLKDYEEIAHLLELKPAATVYQLELEKPKVRYRSKSMDPRDFVKAIKELGFEFVREAKHGWLYAHSITNAIMSIQRPHISQFELNGSTIKKKLVEAGINLDEFEEVRMRLKL
ncbi:hypothetical protein H0O02_01965 [Candidatus Micrarchaeota archaeon]|nr:hypothetical protein [Candidatus Micrarchaeota archaeon]